MSATPPKQFRLSRIPVANVGAVSKRSPLRYPGGKTWLIPHIHVWLQRTSLKTLIESFAGGAIVSLTAVMENLAELAVMIEIDEDVAALWRSALEHGPELRELISEFKPTIDELQKIEKSAPTTLLQKGFRTLVLNRIRRGGILALGASFIRKGENGRGLLSRWYPETLASRLEAIQEHANRITFHQGDGMSLLPVARRSAEARLGSGHGNGIFLSVHLEKPRLLIGDMAARHERFSFGEKTAFYTKPATACRPPQAGETSVWGLSGRAPPSLQAPKRSFPS